MYYNTPFSLFPPNAAISLTDDNSTSFAARPAAFGPKLATQGLSGQLWVGNGFTEDTRDGEGELGCSDLPSWDSGDMRRSLKNSLRTVTEPRVTTAQRRASHSKNTNGDMRIDRDNRVEIAKGNLESIHTVDDGTDDYLRNDRGEPSPPHAGIQSLQEAAEIEGKVVLLMRGGCGFLEKVMWAQRRGAIAVIVGDNQKGGPLIQMFAHGEDVDNVTIPSVFTARTTAQLLSSLTQPGSFIEDSLDENGNPVLKVQHHSKPGNTKSKDQPSTSTRTADFPETTGTTPKRKRSTSSNEGRIPTSPIQERGWLSRLFGWGQSSHSTNERSQPPSSGRLDWVLVDDWSDEKDKTIRETMDKSKAGSKPDNDEFVIGVHDWRDPDKVDKAQSPGQNARDSENSEKIADSENGAYNPYKALPKGFKGSQKGGPGNGYGYALLRNKFGSRDSKDAIIEHASHHGENGPDDSTVPELLDFGPHEGLWVTITPTSSASPFFDTLLVLVISPLVTLTVVYALLIIRARIRRRRWRAPKSVVERLPVRTYHTVAASPSPSSRQPSPSSISPTTPLLQHTPPHSRPRSQTTTGIPESDSPLGPSPPGRSSSRHGTREHEKGTGGFSTEWKKYMGRQVECVVCLEEYVDGVSRVMSLPCGHEFHADCM